MILQILAALLTATASHEGPPTYQAVDLGNLGLGSTGVALNDSAEVVGLSNSHFKTQYSIDTPYLHSFYYKGGQIMDLDPLTGPASLIRSINNKGHAVGRTADSGGNHHAFLYTNQLIDLGTLGGGSSEANCINQDDKVVGFSYVNDSNVHAFLYENGHMEDLGGWGGKNSQALAINALGQIVGFSDVQPGMSHAIYYDKGKWKDLNGEYLESEARGINLGSWVVGWVRRKGSGAKIAFSYCANTMTELGTLGGPSSVANGISAAGIVVGAADEKLPRGQQRVAFIYMDNKMYDLNTLITNIGETHITTDCLIEAVAINSMNQILANDAVGHTYLLMPTLRQR